MRIKVLIFTTALLIAGALHATESVGIDKEGKALIFQQGQTFSNTDSNSYKGSLADGEVLFDTLFDSVQGADERTRVFDTTSFPNRAIGRSSIGCTGTLIGPRVVLTAAHCVYNLKTKTWMKNTDFSPGQNGVARPYGPIGVAKTITTKAYTEEGKTEWDFAVLILDKPIGNQVGWMGYSFDDGLQSAKINISGYPSDKEKGTMWHSFCPVKELQKELFIYLCDTYKGNSGSAIYRFTASTNERKIFGIHTNGFSDHNHGTRITKEKFDKIQSWKAENI